MYMSVKLRIVLFVFSLLWLLAVFLLVKQKRINISNSIIWFITGFIIMIIAVLPIILESFANLFGFLTIANLVIGILITILLVITLRLSIIVTDQKEQIRVLVQQVSLLRKDKEKSKK